MPSAAAAVQVGIAATLILGVAVHEATGTPTEREQALAAQLAKERRQLPQIKRQAYRAGFVRARRVSLTHPDAVIAARLAGLAYGQDPGALLRCADSEGWDWRNRYARHNTVPNSTGSGAYGALQFMPSTFASTPQGRAGLPIYRVDVQLFAAGWMWQRGMRNHWAGAGC